MNDTPERDDVLDAIRRANPVPDIDKQPAPTYDLDEFINRVMSTDPDNTVTDIRSRRPKHRRKITVAVVAAVVLSTGVAAAAVIAARHNNHPEGGVACLSAASKDAQIVVLEPGDNPVGRCGDVWRQGRFDTVPAQEPPPLVACTGDALALEVVPGSSPDVCGQLGLVPAHTELTSDAQAVTDLQEKLAEATGGKCLPVEDATQLANTLLAAPLLTGWTVQVNPPEHPTDVCARTGVDPSTRTVIVGAAPPPK